MRAPGAYDSFDVSDTVSDATGHYALCGLPENTQLKLFGNLYAYAGVRGIGEIAVEAGTTDAVADIQLKQ